MIMRFLLSGLWLVLFAGTINEIYKEQSDNYDSSTVRTIAQVSEMDGKIQFRPNNRYIWRGINKGQRLAVGDNIATGESGGLTINFDNKNQLNISKNTHIRISEMDQKTSSAFFAIELLKGELKANNITLVKDKNTSQKGTKGQSKPAKILINAGVDQFNLISKGSKVGLIKKIGNDIAIIREVKGVVKKSREGKEEILPAFDEKPLLQDVIKLKNFFPKIVSPRRNRILWVRKNLNQLDDLKLKFTLNPGFRRPSIGRWKPILIGVDDDLFGDIGIKDTEFSRELSSDIKYTGRSHHGSQSFVVPFGRFLKNDLVQSKKGSVPEVTYKVKTGGVIFDETGQSLHSFSKKPSQFKIRSFSELSKAKNLRVLIKGPKISRNISAYKYSDESLKPKGSYWIQLKKKSDLNILYPLIFGAREFKIEAISNKLQQKGIFCVKNNKVIVQLGGVLSKKGLQATRDLLGGELIFSGGIDDYLGNISDIGRYFQSASSVESRKAYLWIKNEKFVGISLNFLKEKSVQRYLSKNSIFFKKPVKVISYKGRWISSH